MRQTCIDHKIVIYRVRLLWMTLLTYTSSTTCGQIIFILYARAVVSVMMVWCEWNRPKMKRDERIKMDWNTRYSKKREWGIQGEIQWSACLYNSIVK